MLDAKTRTIGVDKNALDAQVKEKVQMKETDRHFDAKYEQMAYYLDKKVMALEQEQIGIRKALEKEVASAWAEQPKHGRKEWDLSDPDTIKYDLPARVGDEDPRNGPASLQKFSGEDLLAGQRKKLQMAQQKAWCDQQVAEKEQKAADKGRDDKEYMAWLLASHEQRHRVDCAEDMVRRMVSRQQAADNMAEAEAKAERQVQQRLMELEQDATEQYNTYNSALLTEHPAQSQSALSAYRRRQDHYKGMLPEELAVILEYQAAQVDEKKAAAEAERQADMKLARELDDVRKAANRQAASMESFRKEQRMAVLQTVKAQTLQKKEKDASLDAAYSQKIQPTFFDQFGTSHR